LEFLDISEENYKLSFTEVMNDPEWKKRVEDDDNEIKMASDRKEVVETKAEIRRIWLSKLKAESELQTKMIGLQLPNQNMVN